MTVTDIPTAHLGEPLTLRHVGTRRAVVVDAEQWGVALHLAALAGWQAAGTTHPDAPSGKRLGYLGAIGQTIDAEDAAAIAAGLLTSIERYLTATDSEKREALIDLPLHPSRPVGDERPWLALASWRRGSAIAPLMEVDSLRFPERQTPAADSHTIRGLRRLADTLADSGSWYIEHGTPEEWISPFDEVVVVRVRPRSHAQPRQIQLEGKARGAGEEFLCRATIAKGLIAQGVLELASTPIEEGPIPAPSRSLSARLRSFVGV